MNRLTYSLLFHLLLPVILLRLAWRAWRAPAYARRIPERFALGLKLPLREGIWLHAVSLGESIAAAPLIRQLLARYPELPLTITNMTPTGAQRITELFGGPEYAGRVQHCYLPYDLPWSAARFLDQIRPRLAIIMETELWPNHIHHCAQRGIPVVLANARLSERSARGYARFSKLTAPMLAQLSFIAAQTQAEAQRFIQLGARREAVQVSGSIKFDLRIDPALPEQAQQLRAQWQPAGRPVWIAASTHQGEDELILQAHKQLLATHPTLLLILVPRHPERFETVYELCKRSGFATMRRSQQQPVAAHHQVLVGDTLGELLFLYALADLALVGGSLVERGGHNLLEPAALGLPVLSGPHLFNFQEISNLLTQAGALSLCPDVATLVGTICALLDHPEQARAQGAKALAVVQANQGALERLMTGIAERLKPAHS